MKKARFFQLERLPRNFYYAAKQEWSLYSGEENRKLNTLANIFAKIDIDALKLIKKIQEQMITKIGKNLKTVSLNSKATGSEKEQWTST